MEYLTEKVDFIELTLNIMLFVYPPKNSFLNFEKNEKKKTSLVVRNEGNVEV